MERGEGERLHSERRKRFWNLLGGLMLIGMVTGGVAGFVIVESKRGDLALSPWTATLGTIGIVLVAIAVAYGSWRFFVNVDEVEVADNLWGSLIGFYLYAILFPAWWALHKLGQVSEPNDWAILIASMITALAVYLYRKVRYN